MIKIDHCHVHVSASSQNLTEQDAEDLVADEILVVGEICEDSNSNHSSSSLDVTENKDQAQDNEGSHNRGLLSHNKMRVMKYTSLALLTLQNAALILVMRYVRTRPGAMFMSTTAVIMAEVFKLVTCVVIITVQEQGIMGMVRHLNRNIFQQPVDCLKISVPAIVYMIQNNLLYVALSNLEATTFQIQTGLCLLSTLHYYVNSFNLNYAVELITQSVTYQLKILTTALFSVAMLNKQLSRLQWVALMLLFAGIATVQLQPTSSSASPKPSASTEGQSYTLGLVAVIISSVLSGFAGVYFEKLLKGTSQSLYVRNIQLGFIGIVFGIVAMFINDAGKVFENGFFYGYDYVVWFVIFLQSFGGIMVAVVVKYADNILKGFATSCAIVLSCILCMYFFDFELTLLFSFGACLVMLSVYMYSKYIPQPQSMPTTKPILSA